MHQTKTFVATWKAQVKVVVNVFSMELVTLKRLVLLFLRESLDCSIGGELKWATKCDWSGSENV